MTKPMTCIAALSAALLLTSAQAATFSWGTVSATEANWTFSGAFEDLSTGLSYSSGPWTITFDSPTPSPNPGSGDDWSMRAFLQYAGLTGGVTVYHGAELLNPTTTPLWSITMLQVIASGTMANAVQGLPSLYSLAVGAHDWSTAGHQSIAPPNSVPEATSLMAGVVACAVGFLARRRMSV